MASTLAMEILASLPRFGDGHMPIPVLVNAFASIGAKNNRAVRTAFQELLDEYGVEIVTSRSRVPFTINHVGLLKEITAGHITAAISRETWEVAQCEGQRYWDAQYSA